MQYTIVEFLLCTRKSTRFYINATIASLLSKLCDTMRPLLVPNEKALTSGDTTSSVLEETTEPPLSGLRLLQPLAPPPMQEK